MLPPFIFSAGYTLILLFFCLRPWTHYNFEKAFFWFSKAAQKGNTDAQFSLGYMYYNGEGIEKNKKEAAHWLKEASKNGNETAEVYLDKFDLRNY